MGWSCSEVGAGDIWTPFGEKLVCKCRAHFSVIWHLKSSKIWTNYQRTKVWLTENHTHVCGGTEFHTEESAGVCLQPDRSSNTALTVQDCWDLQATLGWIHMISSTPDKYSKFPVQGCLLTVCAVTAEVTPSSSTQAGNGMQIFRWPLSENGTVFRTFGYQTIRLRNLNLPFPTL